MNQSKSSKILERITALEKELQKLKIETFFSLPSKPQELQYPEKYLQKAIRQTRKSIWREKYAQKV